METSIGEKGMKMFLISNMYPTSSNPGFGVFVRNVAEGIANWGISTRYMAVIKGKGGSRLSKVLKYCRFYTDISKHYFSSYDFIYLHFPTYAAPILLFLMWIHRRRLVINFHGEDLLYPSRGFGKFLGQLSDKLTRRYADLIVVPSTYYRDIVIERQLSDRGNIIVSPSGGIDQHIFHAMPLSPMGVFRVGFVGRLESEKGINEFIEACDELMCRHSDFRATVIGYGPMAETVRRKAESNPHYIFLKGVEQQYLPAYYASFDLFIFPSKRKCESLGLVGIEAMACGTPVVGSDVGGIATYLVDGYNGYLVEISSMAEGIIDSVEQHMNKTDAEKKKMGNNAMRTASHYRRDEVCHRLAQSFHEKIRM